MLDIPPAPSATAGETAPEAAAAASPAETAAPVADREPVSERSAPAAAPKAARDAAPVAVPDSAAEASETSAADASLPVEAAAASVPTAASAPDGAVAEPLPDTDPDWIALIALALVGLIPLALAFMAFAWFRRRSRRAGEVEMAVAEREAEPVAMEPVENKPAPIVELAAVREPELARDVHNPLDDYRGQPADGAAVALPAELPETFEERDALLKRMIAAKPDRANPFRSTKARARRARLILQSLGRKFENGRPRIDLSEYTANWPTLARRPVRYA
ncbi:hypothetical protein D2V04_07850 [Pelagerythrobacter aerophilus]|uniref:Uncharacterized protein n=1 Tax=Pelagerythrobacter aerophilus TaxID=2306995 RepID=A0A418NIE2_9SPHN|nr:hypothetical protein D2V04_07850 [Pelagerythrobacter aerophilus]